MLTPVMWLALGAFYRTGQIYISDENKCHYSIGSALQRVSDFTYSTFCLQVSTLIVSIIPDDICEDEIKDLLADTDVCSQDFLLVFYS